VFFAPLALWLLVQGLTGGSVGAVLAGLLLASPAILGLWVLSRLGPQPDVSTGTTSGASARTPHKGGSPGSGA
jgi:hypothetical protein